MYNQRKIQGLENIKDAALAFNCTRGYSKNDDQGRDDQSSGYKRDQRDAATAGGEFTPNDPILTFKVAMEADQENQDSNPNKGGPERFTNTAKPLRSNCGVDSSGVVEGRRQKRREAVRRNFGARCDTTSSAVQAE